MENASNGNIVETIGYVARAINAKQTPNWSTTPYAIQSLLLLLAPPLFAASIYMILGRIIRLINGDALSLVRPKWLTKTFVFGDVISFLVQSGGEFNFNNHEIIRQAYLDILIRP